MMKIDNLTKIVNAQSNSTLELKKSIETFSKEIKESKRIILLNIL